ncbi:MAG: hypothetical protein MJ123_08720 [Lachnospiraceae bacterium]|nr:hypothetical protein [Lachnospiraceae bacterium]
MIGGITGPLSTTLNTIPTMREDAVPVQAIKEADNKPTVVQNSGETTNKHAGRKSSPAECETCKHRKYKDGSNEMVSFKSAAHISPSSAGAQVRAHEQEHVDNAYKKASMNNGKVVSAVVSLHTDICPECGKSYVSGGTTATKIKYYGDNNGYHKAQDVANATVFNGNNINTTV